MGRPRRCAYVLLRRLAVFALTIGDRQVAVFQLAQLGQAHQIVDLVERDEEVGAGDDPGLAIFSLLLIRRCYYNGLRVRPHGGKGYQVARSRDEILMRHGYMPVSEVRELLARIGNRMGQLDEPMAREYVLDPYPGGIEHKIALMCRRRKTMFASLADQEVDRLADGAAALRRRLLQE